MDQVKPGSKYYPLYEHLRRLGESRASLTFQAIERLIGGRLPASARAGKAFWSNRSQGALQAGAWMQAGFHVAAVDLARETVTFARPQLHYRLERAGADLRWDGQAVQALRQHMGLNQAGLAEVLGVRQQTISEWERGVYAPTRSRSKHLTLIAERAGFPLKTE